jgi:hypothetical protein
MRWLTVIVVLSGCLDVSLPARRESGTVSMTAFVQRPASAELVPAEGARLELLGTGLTAVADEGGSVVLSGLPSGTGALSLSFDGNGVVRGRLGGSGQPGAQRAHHPGRTVYDR